MVWLARFVRGASAGGSRGRPSAAPMAGVGGCHGGRRRLSRRPGVAARPPLPGHIASRSRPDWAYGRDCRGRPNGPAACGLRAAHRREAADQHGSGTRAVHGGRREGDKAGDRRRLRRPFHAGHAGAAGGSRGRGGCRRRAGLRDLPRGSRAGHRLPSAPGCASVHEPPGTPLGRRGTPGPWPGPGRGEHGFARGLARPRAGPAPADRCAGRSCRSRERRRYLPVRGGARRGCRDPVTAVCGPPVPAGDQGVHGCCVRDPVCAYDQLACRARRDPGGRLRGARADPRSVGGRAGRRSHAGPGRAAARHGR